MGTLITYLTFALLINILMFIPAFIYKTDKLTDLSYSLTFIFLITFSLLKNSIVPLNIVVWLAVFLWGVRLGAFLFIRIRKITKDKRFDGIRESFFAFLRFWVLQGLAVWVILLPSLLFIQSDNKSVFMPGISIWLFGLIIESFADLQKYKFTQNPSNKDKFINVGLWKYSRHPNYFGEILCWLGIYIFVFPSLSFLFQIIALSGPLFIVVLLLFATGIPPLEKYADKKWGKDKSYVDYKSKTSILIPWFNKNA
ncbi:DUF1295 domain-containing protein [bacterium]|nr:DUF1295 domain-containing protein [bacterium]